LMAQLVAVGEHRLSVEAFEQRWRDRRRDQVREAAPARGLCLLRAGYADEIFSKAGWYDCQPWFALATDDPPPDPPCLPDTSNKTSDDTSSSLERDC
jgi:tRNA pseudouridine38-40 synthase